MIKILFVCHGSTEGSRGIQMAKDKNMDEICELHA